MKQRIYIIILFFSSQAFGQNKPFSQKFETDSSTVEIIRNSLYKCWNETYKFKDSARFISWFIDDTTQIHYEQWQRKNGLTFIGVSREFKKDGTLMYELNHDEGTCWVNRKFYPNYEMLQEMKIKADSLIIKTYSKDFYTNHVKFKYEGSAWIGEWKDYEKGPYWSTSMVGSWTEPMTKKPNHYRIVYRVKLSPNDKTGIELGIELDSLGNYFPSNDDDWGNYGFEKVEGNNRTFNIDQKRAIEIAHTKGLFISDSSEVSEFLKWEKSGSKDFYNGQYRYYISVLTDTEEYTKGDYREGIIYRYDVYSFNPWTGEFVEMKKMKRIHEWGNRSGYSTRLLPDND